MPSLTIKQLCPTFYGYYISSKQWIVAALKRIRKAARISFAWVWRRFYLSQNAFTACLMRYVDVIKLSILTVLVVGSAFWIPVLQYAVAPLISDSILTELKTLFVTIGGALLASSAIVSSLVLFAMQVNVERMPYGLFRKLGADKRLLFAFGATFVLAIVVAILSVTPKAWAAFAIWALFWGLSLTLVLFLYAYRRALTLISPTLQIRFLMKSAKEDLELWTIRGTRMAPLLEEENAPKDHNQPEYDSTRMLFFKANPHWTMQAQQAILHAISFSRRYAKEGDHEVSAAALNAIIHIHAAYVTAKGRTFFSNDGLLDNPLVTDGFLNETLEQLRQNVQMALADKNEQQLEQNFQTFTALLQVYVGIQYPYEYSSKTHAHLIAGYLDTAVQSVLPHGMPDVAMEGVRCMGQSAQLLLSRGGAKDIATLAEKIGLMACAGVAREDYRPITLCGMEQLAKLTFNLIRTKSQDSSFRFAASALKNSVVLAAKLFLAVPDAPLTNTHSTYLAPYYSGTSIQSLRSWLVELVNAVAEAQADDENAKIVISNIESWSEDLCKTEKELLLLAVERKSPFTFDIIHWISGISEMLMAISNAPACNVRTKEKLLKNALWLVSILSWLPDDRECIIFLETYSMTETLFEIVANARARGDEKIYHKTRELFLAWAFKAGRQQTGWASLERSLYGLAALSLLDNNEASISWLNDKINDRLSKEDAPDEEIRRRTARDIRRRLREPFQREFSLSNIDRAMGAVDTGRLGGLLAAIANSLSPSAAPERW